MSAKPDFKTPLTTLDEAKRWVEQLVGADLMFHFEDSPETIINGPSGERIFTDEEAEDVAARVAEMYAMDWSPAGTECPIGYAMKVEDRRQIAEQFGGAL